ncbi:hypothetical protein DVK02_15655 [Halobellus sp. Atlit-31R]|nr:hypothetical protein DVK02_15655 [Halobellus sp. Atlit-31R]
MSWGSQRDEARRSHREFLAIRYLDIDAAEQGMFARQNLGAGEFCQACGPELEILLAMRFDAIGNAQVIVACQLQILCHVPPRIDDHCKPIAASEHIGVVA